MIARTFGAFAVAYALVALAGCSEAKREHVPQNADERLADDVMTALLNDDMRPVIHAFVPARKPDLLSPAHVKTMHDFVRGGGAFLGARELEPPSKTSTICYLVATFQNGDVALQMLMDGKGKIVHYHLGGALSPP